MGCKQKFWIENFPDLLCSSDVIPLNNMSLENQMNSLTRLVFLIFVILLVTGSKYSIIFFVFSVVVIIVLYFIKRKKMENYTIEHFNDTRRNTATSNIEYYRPALLEPQQLAAPTSYDRADNNGNSSEYMRSQRAYNQIGLHLPSASRWCDDQTDWDFNNPNYISENQRLVGKPNPKTQINPVVVPPAYDFDYWKANNLAVPSYINDVSQFDSYLSGYQVSDCCGMLFDKELVPVPNPVSYAVPIEEDIADVSYNHNHTGPTILHRGRRIPDRAGHGDGGHGSGGHQQAGSGPTLRDATRENYEFPFLKTGPQIWPTEVFQEQPGQINTACGYNPTQQFSAALPTNQVVGNCQKDPAMYDYNENLYTQYIQPNVNVRSQVNEPINSNMGISFTQQLLPTTCSENIYTGDVNYLRHDPRLLEPAIVEPNLGVIDDVNYANVYDPRHTGYGTSYRSYTDPLLGQPKYYYQDIDSIRMPNYITRSNIDFTPYADSYGTAPTDGAWGNPNNSNIRALANDTFLRDSLGHRNDLMLSLSHKANVRQAQLRQAPIRTMNYASSGGMGSCTTGFSSSSGGSRH